MPIELKKPISSLADLTCENCIHYQKPPRLEEICINPEGNNWDQEKDDCCSLGQWLKIAHYDNGDGINLFNFSMMMLLFAEEKLDATINNS